MFQQKIQRQSLDGFRGILVVLGTVAAAVIGSAFFTLLGNRIGSPASILFILYCCAIAWLLTQRYVLGFVYTTDGNCLRICRVYGKRERFMCDIWLNKVQTYGDPETVKQRFPNARIDKAIKSQCTFAPFAMAYKDAGKQAIIIIQPNEELKALLLEKL